MRIREGDFVENGYLYFLNRFERMCRAYETVHPVLGASTWCCQMKAIVTLPVLTIIEDGVRECGGRYGRGRGLQTGRGGKKVEGQRRYEIGWAVGAARR